MWKSWMNLYLLEHTIPEEDTAKIHLLRATDTHLINLPNHTLTYQCKHDTIQAVILARNVKTGGYTVRPSIICNSTSLTRRHARPADLFYNDAESAKYTTSSRIQNIQSSMTHRALELLDLKSPSLILDIGCGSGLSGEILSSVSPHDGGPHTWIGMDVSASMLDIALQRDVEGDLMLADIGQGIPFRPGAFDAALSISAIQWLCNADRSDVSPQGRLARFFNGLYASLRRGGRAVCQFYPKNEVQRTMISGAAVKAGFGAGILEDDPGTKNAKLYLVLTIGGGEIEGGDITGVVKGMDGVDVMDARKRREKGRLDPKKGSKAWILKKKEKMERKGKIVKTSSKYTGRSRGPKF